jgi:hypothetical protein
VKTTKRIQDAVDANPEIRLVLEIAALARDTEARELPREIGSSSEVIVIPTHAQAIV